jgi:GntR family transcriptional regulator, arabinose operon transcriptional repressor
MSNELLERSDKMKNDVMGTLPKNLRRQPLHKQISEIIRSPIRSGQLPPGSKIPTEMELIEKYNVSRITVRRAFQELMAEGLIEGRKRQGTFVRMGASFLAIQRYVFIHAQAQPLTHPFQQSILKGIQSLSQNLEFRLELLALPFRENRPLEDTTASDLIESCKFHGAIAISGLMHQEELRRLAYKHIPVVWIGRNDIELPPQVIKVECNSEAVNSIMLSHLKETGRKRLGFIGTPSDEIHNYKEQVISYMAKSGLDFRESSYEPSGWGISPACKACQKLLKRCPELDAIVASDDLQALGALQAVRAAGKKVPEDIAIIGSGNFFEAGEQDAAICDITTVDLQVFEQGRAAVECLKKLILGEHVEPNIWIEPKLVRRQTT